MYVFIENFKFERRRNLKFEISVIQLDQMVKIKLMLLNLLAQIETSC
jgi:hypothetical protein